MNLLQGLNLPGLNKNDETQKPLENDGTSLTLTTDEIDLGAMKAEAVNRMVGDLGELDCQLCRNKGYIAVKNGDGIVTHECACVAKRRVLKRIRQSGMGDMLAMFTFENYATPKQWQKDVKNMAIEYITDGFGKWFIIVGESGTGKTHLCTAMCSELIEAGKHVRYMLWRQEAPRLKALVYDRTKYEQEMRNYMRADVLYIDDFFKGAVTDADLNLAFELLNARYNAPRTQTIISSEKSIEELLDIDEAIGSRIYERSKGFSFRAPNENWRLVK